MSINFISILIILITYVASYIKNDICFQVKRQTVYKRDKLFYSK